MAAQTPSADKKMISSRLASMKFMQRGVASGAPSPTTPTDTGDRSAKRRKSSHVITPVEVASPVIDQKAVQAALEKDEQKRLAAIKIQAEEAGDSHWVLPGPFPHPSNGEEAALKVRYLSQAEIDHMVSDEEDSSEDGKAMPVFRRYNMPERKRAVTSTTTGDNESDSDDSDGSDSNQSPLPASKKTADPKLKRKRSSSEFSTRRKAENERAHQFADQRRRKDVKLNTLGSISGAGASRGGESNMKCFNCGQVGHRATKCPTKGNRH